jgi:uncharacterized protein (TIGR03067 family)
MSIPFAITVIAFLQAPFSEGAKKELKSFSGEWEYVAAQTKDAAIDVTSQTHIMCIDGADWTVRVKGTETVSQRLRVVALDDSTDPKVFDLVFIPKEADREATVREGIYNLDGDPLVFALYYGAGKRRPSGFGMPQDADTIVWVLKRLKK